MPQERVPAAGTGEVSRLGQQAEKALRASEARYRALLQKLQAAVVVHGPDTRIVISNPVAQALLGLTEEQLLGKTVADPEWKFFREDGTVMPSEEYPVNQVLARRQPLRNLVVGVHRPDNPRNLWAIVNADPVFDHEQSIVETIVTFIDITERKQAEEALREKEERLQMIVRSEPECVKIVSPEGTLLEMNPAGLEMIEAESCAMVVGKPVIDLIHPEDRQAWMRLHSAVVAGGSGTLQFRIIGLLGTLRWLESRSVPLHDRHGTTVSVLSVTRDITERKRAEEGHLANLHFFASMDRVNRAIQGASALEPMLSGVLETTRSLFDCDRSWLLYPCDPEAPSFRVPMEITKPEYPGANALNLDVPMSPGQAQNMREALESEVPVTYTAGTERPISTASQFGVQSQMFICVYPKGGKPWVFGVHQCSYPRLWTQEEKRLFQEIGRRLADGLTSLLAVRDLRESEAKYRQLNAELEQRVQQRTAQLHAANANLQTFAYSAAHDLRSPLRSIEGFSKIALAEYGPALAPTGRSMLERISSSAGQMDRLLSDLLDYSKISQAELKLGNLSLQEAVRDALALLEADIRAKNAAVTVAGALPEIIGHHATVVLLIHNFVSNALKYVAPGVQPQIRIRAETRPRATCSSQPATNFVRLSVQDNGIGIAPTDLGKVFEVFQRLHGRDVYPGTGLGLAIARKAAERMGGCVGVESQLGKGSEFWVELPSSQPSHLS